MKPFTVPELQSLRVPHVAPCISLYLPTSHPHLGSGQDALRIKNPLGTAERLLCARYTSQDIQMLLEPLEILANGDFWRYLEALSDNGCWRTQMNGLAVFRSPDFTGYYQIPMRLPEVAVVADTFHVKPLLTLRFRSFTATGEDRLPRRKKKLSHASSVSLTTPCGGCCERSVPLSCCWESATTTRSITRSAAIRIWPSTSAWYATTAINFTASSASRPTKSWSRTSRASSQNSTPRLLRCEDLQLHVFSGALVH